jgi:hypothetical protein
MFTIFLNTFWCQHNIYISHEYIPSSGIVWSCFTIWRTAQLFFQASCTFTFLPRVHEVSSLSLSSAIFVIFHPVDYSHTSEVVPPVTLIHRSVMDNNVLHVIICFLAICLYYLKKYKCIAFSHFKNLGFYLLLSSNY